MNKGQRVEWTDGRGEHRTGVVVGEVFKGRQKVIDDRNGIVLYPRNVRAS